MAATFATVLALAVAIESIAVLPTAVAAVLPVANESIAVLPVESIFQEALDVWSPRLPPLAVVLSFQIDFARA